MGFLSCEWREPPSCAKRQHGIPSPSKSNSSPSEMFPITVHLAVQVVTTKWAYTK